MNGEKVAILDGMVKQHLNKHRMLFNELTLSASASGISETHDMVYVLAELHRHMMVAFLKTVESIGGTKEKATMDLLNWVIEDLSLNQRMKVVGLN